MSMADSIKKRRLAMGLTQEELAHKLKLQKSAIAKYENGRIKNIKRTTILKMSDILACSPTCLLGLDESSKMAERLMAYAEKLNEKGMQKVEGYIEGLLENSEYLQKTDI